MIQTIHLNKCIWDNLKLKYCLKNFDVSILRKQKEFRL